MPPLNCLHPPRGWSNGSFYFRHLNLVLLCEGNSQCWFKTNIQWTPKFNANESLSRSQVPLVGVVRQVAVGDHGPWLLMPFALRRRELSLDTLRTAAAGVEGECNHGLDNPLATSSDPRKMAGAHSGLTVYGPLLPR